MHTVFALQMDQEEFATLTNESRISRVSGKDVYSVTRTKDVLTSWTDWCECFL